MLSLVQGLAQAGYDFGMRNSPITDIRRSRRQYQGCGTDAVPQMGWGSGVATRLCRSCGLRLPSFFLKSKWGYLRKTDTIPMSPDKAGDHLRKAEMRLVRQITAVILASSSMR